MRQVGLHKTLALAMALAVGGACLASDAVAKGGAGGGFGGGGHGGGFGGGGLGGGGHGGGGFGGGGHGGGFGGGHAGGFGNGAHLGGVGGYSGRMAAGGYGNHVGFEGRISRSIMPSHSNSGVAGDGFAATRVGHARPGRDHGRGHDHRVRFVSPIFIGGYGYPYLYGDYDYYDDYDAGCWQSQRVHTPRGWRWRKVDVCTY